MLSAKIHDAAKFVTPAPMARAFIFSPSSSSAHDSDHRACVRLPKLNLPSSPFLEKYDEWFPFFDTFNTVIHSNTLLFNTQ